MNYRQTTLDSLTAANNKFAVSLLIELMDESNLEVPPGDFAVATMQRRRQMEIMVERKQRRFLRQVTGHGCRGELGDYSMICWQN